MPTSFLGWFALLAILSSVGLVLHAIWVDIFDPDPHGIKKARSLQQNSGGGDGIVPTYGGDAGCGGDGGGSGD